MWYTLECLILDLEKGLKVGFRQCEVPGCANKHVARGLCGGHYQRLKREGDVLEDIPLTKSRPGDRNPKWRGGKSRHPLYLIYRDMVARCRRDTHQRYGDYGGRGVNVCQEWVDDFWQFVADVGDRPEGKTRGGYAYWQLDRINNNGNYEPGNVRWATPEQQAENRRDKTLATHCRRGHKYSQDNTYINPTTGSRRCRTCDREIESRRERKWVNGRYITIPRGTQPDARSNSDLGNM